VLLDFGATVKGWAADQAAGHIARELGCGALVSLGGDTAVAGQPPAGGWRIRIPDVPGLPTGAVQAGAVQAGAVQASPVQVGPVQVGSGRGSGQGMVVAIRDGGLATSSAMARRWRRGTDILHHILDPRSGLPAAPVWHSVSVAAASCADANTAAVAAIIRGHQAPGWLAGLGLPARLIATDGTVRTVAGWPGPALTEK
jgi:thiamine biosynthesis lipoprotein